MGEAGFNSRARVGRDDHYGSVAGICFSFNSRARVGRDILSSWRGRQNSCFNSRARVGRDGRLNFAEHELMVSIRAPV